MPLLTLCLSVMLHSAPHQPIVGVVYNFVTEELFAAQTGKGATVNGKPLLVSQCTGESVCMHVSMHVCLCACVCVHMCCVCMVHLDPPFKSCCFSFFQS